MHVFGLLPRQRHGKRAGAGSLHAGEGLHTGLFLDVFIRALGRLVPGRDQLSEVTPRCVLSGLVYLTPPPPLVAVVNPSTLGPTYPASFLP